MNAPKAKIPDTSNIPLCFLWYSQTTKDWNITEYSSLENCWADYDDYKDNKPCGILNFGAYIINNFS